MTVTELLEHPWLNDKTARDIPLDSPSIIIADEVCYQFFVPVKGMFLSLSYGVTSRQIMTNEIASNGNNATDWSTSVSK